MNLTRQWAVPAVAALLAAAAAATWYLAGRSDEPQATPPREPAAPAPAPAGYYTLGAAQLAMVRSEVLAASAVPMTEPLSARVVYNEDVTARISVPIAGRIVAIKAAPGDRVSAGQVLAEMDSPDFGSARADLDKARADEERKGLAVERARQLGAGEAIASKDLEGAEADYKAAIAERQRAQQRMANLNPRGLTVTGQRVGLTSPMDGVVTERTATPALEAGPGLPAPLFVVTDPRHLWLMVDLPEKLLPRVKPGGAIAVESDAYPDERFTARVVQVGPVLDPNTRRVAMRARLDGAEARLLPEMFVRASLLQEGGRGVRVPNRAIVYRGIYAYVFVEQAPGRFQRREVKLLTRGGDFSYVGEGLQGGERVVTAGALLLDAEVGTTAGERR